MCKSNKILISRYTLELLIIIFGITISFILNEWREGQQNHKTEKMALQSILKDLIADSITINKEIESIREFQNLFAYFIRNASNRKANPDSIAMAIGSFAIYTTLEIKNVGYEQVKVTGQLGLISNKELLTQIIDIYTNHYAIAKEYTYIDKKMVLEQYIPFLIKDSPLSLNEINSSEDFLKSKEYQALVENRTFRNMFFLNMGFKKQIVNQTTQLKNQIRALIADIKKELNK